MHFSWLAVSYGMSVANYHLNARLFAEVSRLQTQPISSRLTSSKPDGPQQNEWARSPAVGPHIHIVCNSRCKLPSLQRPPLAAGRHVNQEIDAHYVVSLPGSLRNDSKRLSWNYRLTGLRARVCVRFRIHFLMMCMHV